MSVVAAGLTAGKIALGLIRIAEWFAARADRTEMRQSGIDKQIADSLISFTRRVDVGLTINREQRTIDADLDELRPKSRDKTGSNASEG